MVLAPVAYKVVTNVFYFCQTSEYFLRKTCAKCSFSEILLYKLKLDQIRIYDVHPQLIGAVTGHLQAYFCFKKC